MRERHVCPKCQHNRILFINKVPDRDDVGFQAAAIAIVTQRGVGLFGGDRVGIAGALSACVCRRCGFTELYTQAPESIPIDGEDVQELIGAEPREPYR